jgi:hypothetical protein
LPEKGGLNMRKKGLFWTLAMAIALVFLSCIFVARSQAADVYAPSLPNDVNIVAPAADLPKELAAFSGKWGGNIVIVGGRYSGSVDVILVVEEVGTNKARVIYSVGTPRVGGATSSQKASYKRYEGKVFAGGSMPKIEFMTEAGSTLIFEMNPDLKSLKGFYKIKGGGAGKAKMDRIE